MSRLKNMVDGACLLLGEEPGGAIGEKLSVDGYCNMPPSGHRQAATQSIQTEVAERLSYFFCQP